ncbi:hypothetical protein KKH43_04270 [Patescibacteria group bacterium]|nr:hypothetical protein [Patescibacteria group bacterium]
MRQSNLFSKTIKEIPKEETSINAQLLIKAGYIDKLQAGVYSFLPLGHRVHEKVKNVIREEMNAVHGQEIYMPALHPKAPWAKTGRWESETEVMFQFVGRGDKDLGLGWTHEEVVTPLGKKFIQSYKDLPKAVYQIQDKFRNERRAKSGLLRGREFSMKDLYSFHISEEDLSRYYDDVLGAYERIFKRLGLDALLVEASGGAFSKYSHEFQVVTKYGEDIIFVCEKCGRNQNKEIIEENACPGCGAKREEKKAIEVGNIFKLKTRYSDAFDFKVQDKDGTLKEVHMGCYGIGPSRVMGTIVEVSHDDNGVIWPKEVTPYQVHLLALSGKEGDTIKEIADETYELFKKEGLEVLYDDRDSVSPGEKFADADLYGMHIRVVVGKKSMGSGDPHVEVTRRDGAGLDFVDKQGRASSADAAVKIKEYYR